MSQNPPLFTLIHGTWARNAEWVKPSAPIAAALTLAFPGSTIRQFAWSGRNGLMARRNATHELAIQLRANDGREQFIVAHSHGGNIAATAVAEAGVTVAGIVCLNVPFLVSLRRDTSHEAEVVPACLFWLACLPLIQLWYTGEFSVWLTSAVAIATLAVLGLISSLMGRLEHRIDKQLAAEASDLERAARTPFFCLTTRDDEAFNVLALLDAVANLPRMAFDRYAMTFWFFLPLVLIFFGYLPVVDFAAPEIVWKQLRTNAADPILGGASFMNEIRGGNPDWPWYVWVEMVFLSVVLYAMQFIATLFTISFLSGLARAIPFGEWMAPWRQPFVRTTVSLVPIGFRDVEFRELPVKTEELRHSALHSDNVAVEAIVEWVKGHVYRGEIG